MRFVLAALLAGVALAGCGQSESDYTKGYPGQSLGSSQAKGETVTPPSSGTSNGTGMSVPQGETAAREPGEGVEVNAAASATPAEQDRQFLYHAIDSHLAAVAMDELALKKAQTDAVKAFAERALAAGRRRGETLAALAQAAQVSPPDRPDKEYRDLHDNLAAISGEQFDRLYMRDAVVHAQRMINLYEQEATRGKNAAVRSFVAEALPELQRHYEQARDADLALPKAAPLMSPSGRIETHQPSPPPMSH